MTGGSIDALDKVTGCGIRPRHRAIPEERIEQGGVLA
jgi:hypothetical protein